MKHLLLLFTLLLAFTQAQAASFEKDIDNIREKLAAKLTEAKVKNIAVIDFTDVHSNITELGRFIAEELSTSLVLTRNSFSVIDRSHLKYILNEQKLSISGLLDPKNTIKIGKLAGVDALILGTITPFGDNVRLTVKVLDTKTAHLITGERATIAKTQAINELLNREVVVDYPVATGGSSSGNTPASYSLRKYPPATFTTNGLVFKSKKLLVGKDRVTFIMQIQNTTKKDIYLWLVQSGVSTAYTSNCPKYIGNINTFIYSSSGNQGYVAVQPALGIESVKNNACNTSGTLVEKQGLVTTTLTFNLKDVDTNQIYDFSSAMFLSEDGKSKKRISVAFTDLKAANKPKFKASE